MVSKPVGDEFTILLIKLSEMIPGPLGIFDTNPIDEAPYLYAI